MSIRDELAQVIAVALAETNPSGLGTFDELSPNRQKQLLSRGGHAADAILARFGVVGLPTLNEPDDDGQIYTDVAELRIDTSGTSGNEVFLPGGHRISPYWLRQEAADYLAAANRAEAQS
ncbi:hypothetical protein MYP14_06155 [Rhodococcus pyridinivorans]|uniref:hypothetical protein n=1 Tax=Rhodococcus pyridinivorans TaxID=103816 RepID=UPI001FFEA330|nr:hypothetical protein [Rhodococcus pyridinivorans]UPK64932.1 hypothetical protein MYP14_06155 [Rhodococcus pyridinivorans]